MKLVERANVGVLDSNQTLPTSQVLRSFHHSWINYVSNLVVTRYEIQVGEFTFVLTPSDKVVISPGFFRDFKCTCCGRCCEKINTSLFYSNVEAEMHRFTVDDLSSSGFVRHPITISYEKDMATRFTINDSVWISRWNINVKGKCPWLTFVNPVEKTCAIHRIKPIQCILSPIYVDTSVKKADAANAIPQRKTARFIKRLIGRNWRFGCEMKQQPWNLNVLAQDISKLELLDKVANSYRIQTVLPKVIETLKNVQKEIKECLIINL